MARITVEDCQANIQNRFLLASAAFQRVRQRRDGFTPLVESDNKDVVSSLREIASFHVSINDPINDPGSKRVVEDEREFGEEQYRPKTTIKSFGESQEDI